MRNKVFYLIIVNVLNAFIAFSQEKKDCVVIGVVCDAQTKEPLSFATIQLFATGDQAVYSGISSVSGHFKIKGLSSGEYTAIVSFLGYDKFVYKMVVPYHGILSFQLSSTINALDEIVVTASESKGLTSSSKIDRKAMEHLQPTSFTDLLELLPGGRSVDPNMSGANLIRLREAGNTDAAIASLGVDFIVDGLSMNTDANLQYVPGYSKGGDKESVGLGVDMRTLSTDNIESVEIVRGIPSVKYGNLTSGLVKIKRKHSASPFTARFKADQVGKSFAIGKGISIGRSHVLNVDLSVLDSKIDPRNSYENYKRLIGSIRWDGCRQKAFGEVNWGVNVDYTGSFDRVKRDKDATIKQDSYRSSYDKFKWSARYHVRLNDDYTLRKLDIDALWSYELNEIRERRSVSIDRPTGIPTTSNTGAADGFYLPYHYVADLRVDGKPIYASLRMNSEWRFRALDASHKVLLGGEWNLNKNLGRGPIYDLTRPLNAASFIRPRSYRDIPALQHLGFYAEDTMDWWFRKHRLSFSAGVRGTTLLALDKAYQMHERVYFDPRLSFQWEFPMFRDDWKANINVGFGWLTRMPTLMQIYPDDIYVDIMQLNYYHVNANLRRLNLMTYKWKNVNYDLEPSRNKKWDLRLNLTHKGHSFSMTYFTESMNNAFGVESYFKALPYKRYDTSSINSTELVAPPNLRLLDYREDTLINTYAKQGNTISIHKKGVEFEYFSPRMKRINTRISFTGAWYKTVYRDKRLKYREASILINNEQLQYIGLYDSDGGVENERLSTNLTIDTYLPKIGMLFSFSNQCTWFTSRKQLRESGVPISYIDRSGTTHPFTEQDKDDLQLKHLLKTYGDSYFQRNTVPFALDLNMKLTKKVGQYMRLSLFVNRLLSYYPQYKVGNTLIKRTSSPYFGMEVNLNF